MNVFKLLCRVAAGRHTRAVEWGAAKLHNFHTCDDFLPDGKRNPKKTYEQVQISFAKVEHSRLWSSSRDSWTRNRESSRVDWGERKRFTKFSADSDEIFKIILDSVCRLSFTYRHQLDRTLKSTEDAMQCNIERTFRAQTQYVTIIIEIFSSKLMAYSLLDYFIFFFNHLLPENRVYCETSSISRWATLDFLNNTQPENRGKKC